MSLPPLWVRIPTTAFAAYAVWVGAAFALQDRLVFTGPVEKATPAAPDPLPYKGERVPLTTDEGVVEGWFFPGDGVSAETPGPAVLFAHGNAELMDDWPWMLDDYYAFGVSVLLYEYRGYGRSAGHPTQRAVIDDGVAFYDLLVARPDVDPDRVVLHGRSLGGGVMAAVSRQRPARLLVLQSAFASLGALGWRFAVPPFAVQDEFEPLEAVRAFAGRTLIVHGTSDPLFPFTHAEALRAASPRALLQAMDCEHNDCAMQLISTVVREQMAEVGVIAPLTDEQKAARRFLRPPARLR